MNLRAVFGALRALGAVHGLIFGQYGKSSEDAHSLLRAAAKSPPRVPGARAGAPPPAPPPAFPRLTALLLFVRLPTPPGLSWGCGVTTIRERYVRWPAIALCPPPAHRCHTRHSPSPSRCAGRLSGR
eukprot:scaffold11037_cov124-Isochrysis_galbana.AAC.1